MKQLSKAIISQYSDSTGTGTLYAGLTGGLWNSQAPEGTSYPYAVFYLISNVPSHVMEGEFTNYKYENPLIQFSIYDDDTAQDTVEDIYDKLTDLFDEATLTLTNYTTVNFTREFDHLEKIRGESGSYWQYVVQYRGLFERTAST